MTRKTEPGPLFNTRLTAPNVLTVRFDDIRIGWEQWVLLRSDAHHDNAWCDQELERAHLDLAVERKALVLDFGDLFDAMQGPNDKRASKDQMRTEHSRTNYFDELVKSAEAFYAPYAGRFGLMAIGNHETAVSRHYATNLTDRLTDRLRHKHGGLVQTGGYGGWVRFMFNVQKTVRQQIRLKYFHGAGGGGPVTRGVIQTNRQAVYLPDADVVVNGHTHDSWLMPIARERLTDGGRVVHDLQHHVRCSTYKDDYQGGEGGWHVERAGAPKPLGACWMRLFLPSGPGQQTVAVEFTQAVRAGRPVGVEPPG